jgi:hypothetical protein
VISVYSIFESSWGNNSKAEIIFLWAIGFPNIKCTGYFPTLRQQFLAILGARRETAVSG